MPFLSGDDDSNSWVCVLSNVTSFEEQKLRCLLYLSGAVLLRSCKCQINPGRRAVTCAMHTCVCRL